MAKILLVEDDLELMETVEDHLRYEHHAVESVSSGKDALHLLTVSSYDLIIIDWGLPDLTGIEVIREFRSSGGSTPILMLTGKSAAKEKAAGLDTGADDYLTKPFELIEFEARVRALLRRPAQVKEDVLSFDKLKLDVKSFYLTRDGQNIPLTSKEFALMEFFMRHPCQTFSPEAILERVWRSDERGSAEGVRACIKRVREKLDVEGQPSYIRNVHGFGYKLDRQD